MKIPYYKVQDALEMAKVINGCDIFISNQTSTLAIAIGLQTVNIIQEVYEKMPNCIFPYKKNMKYK